MPSAETCDAPAHRILLTFDDGPDPLCTVSVLNELARWGLKAVFFVLGQQLESPDNRAILQRIASDGHFIGNHGYFQHNLTNLTDEQIRVEARRTEVLIGNLDRGVKLWRPPFGTRDDRVDSIFSALGYTRMLWSVDSLDWRENGQAVSWVDHTIERIRLRRIRGFRNSVCLLHDTCPGTAAQLGHLLERMSALPGTRIARYNPGYCDSLRVSEETNETDVLHTSPGIPPGTVSFQLGNAYVLARPRVNTLYILNQSASLLWDTLAGGASAAEAAQTLAREYDLCRDQATSDVESALANWRARGLLGPNAPELEDPGPWLRSLNEVHPADCHDFEEDHAYRFLDLRFRIRFQTADLAKAIHPRFANLEVQDLEVQENAAAEKVFEIVSIRGGYILCMPDGVATSHPSAAALSYELFFEITTLAHQPFDPMACLHSSLVGCGAATAAFVANNGSGKSTVTAALGSAGFPILSDDRLFLDFATRRPVATPNAVSLKPGSWQPLLSRYPAIFQLPVIQSDREEVRFLLPPAPTERLLPGVKYLFFPRYSPVAETAAIPLTTVEAIERIAAAESWISSQLEKLRAFLEWTQGLRCYDLPYSSLNTAVERIKECIRP